MAIEVSSKKHSRRHQFIRNPETPLPLDHLSVPPAAVGELRYKPWFDRLVALVLLAPGLPLMAALALLVRLTSPGPGIYRQSRTGLGGRSFTMYKLRSMSSDAEARTGAVWASRRDPRITPLGKFLRKYHLDELPQLFNVVMGDMSLVGPRPERPEIVAELVAKIPDYLARLAVAPGVTGLAQVNLPPDTVLDDVRRKLVLDREYAAQANLGLDLRILLCTLARVCGIPNRLPRRWLGLERKVVLSNEADPVVIDFGAVRAPALATVRDE
jgi:lipopolysaccharide/colanic/teichoic acid biosynthesis glycosyltransferase